MKHGLRYLTATPRRLPIINQTQDQRDNRQGVNLSATTVTTISTTPLTAQASPPRFSRLDDSTLCYEAASISEKIDVRFIHDTDLLHRFFQIIRSGKGFRLIKVGSFKNEDHLVRIVGTPQQMFFREACGSTGRSVSVIAGFPF